MGMSKLPTIKGSMDDRKEMSISMLLSYICLFANVAGSLVITPILVGRFGTSEYGLYMLAYSVGMYVNVDGMGIGGVVVRQVKKYLTLGEKEDQSVFLFQSLLVFALLAAVSYVVLLGIGLSAGAIFAGSVTPENITRLKWMINATAINCALMFFFNLVTSIITGYNKLIFIKSITLSKILVRTLIVICMIGWLRVETLIMVDIGITCVLLALSLSYAFKGLGVRIKAKLDKLMFKQTLKQTGYVFVSLVSDNVCWNSGSMIVTISFGEASAGVFSIAMTLCGVFSQLSSSISGLFLPDVTGLIVSKASNETLQDKMIKTGRYLLALLMLVIVGFGLVGQEFLLMYLGEDFLPAYNIALPLMIALLYPSTQLVGDSIIQGMNKFNMRSTIQLLSSITTIVFSLLLTPVLGLEGSWVGLAISVVVFRIVVTNVYLQRLGMNMMRYFSQTVPRMALLCVILVPALALLFRAVPMGFIPRCLLTAALYLLGVWLIYLNREEKQLLPAMLQKLKRK